MNEYKIKKILKVYDGDTITAEIDLGFGITITEKIRLLYINAPEVRGTERPQGLISRDWLREKLDTNEDIIIKTEKDKKGKYGRYLGEIYVSGVSLNKLMIQEGFADPYKK